MNVLSLLSTIASVVQVICSHTDTIKPTVTNLCSACLAIAKTINASPNHELCHVQKELVKADVHK